MINRLLLLGGPRAALKLDFLNESVDSRITYSGGANATRVNSAGALVSASAPITNYSPVSLACRGLLVEEARTNLALSSEDFRTSAEGNPVTAWNEAAAAVAEQSVAKDVVGPDGVANSGTTITWSGATAGNTRWQQATKASGATTAHTIYLQQGSTQYTALQSFFSGGTSKDSYAVVNWTAGTVAVAGGDAANATATLTPHRDGWYIVSIVHVDTGANTLARISVAPTQSNGTTVITGTVLCFGAQIEAGAFALGYVPTTTATVTRSADSAIISGANFLASHHPEAGSAVVEFDLLAVTGTRPIISFDDDSANNRIELYASGTDLKLLVVSGGVTQADLTLGTVAANTSYRAAFAWRANDFAACMTGGQLVTDTAGTVPTVDRLRLGSNQAGDYQNGHIKKLDRWNRRIADSRLI